MKGSLERHCNIQDSLEERLRGYGYKTYTNIEYQHKGGRTLGEIDILAFVIDKKGYLKHINLYEVKSSNENFRHASQQLRRAKDYFSSSKVPVNMVYVGRIDGELRVRRVR